MKGGQGVDSDPLLVQPEGAKPSLHELANDPSTFAFAPPLAVPESAPVAIGAKNSQQDPPQPMDGTNGASPENQLRVRSLMAMQRVPNPSRARAPLREPIAIHDSS